MSSTRLRVVGLVMVGVLLGTSAMTGACQVPLPAHPEGRGGQCVRDTEFMRRNHMELILHKRDQTMHEGIRTSEYSLKECVKCHAEQRPDGSYVPINDPGQFCQSCHSYAGIQPDCFECHATTPAIPPASKP
ncbi:Hdr-like menaquinol oxidoreductase cytochrome c subunit [Gammaproteobacteria bacterium]